MKNPCILTATLVLGGISAQAQVSISTDTTFGNNGWLAPGSSSYDTTGTTERGLAFGNNELYLVSRASGNNIEILDPGTGALTGSLSTTGISGGTFAVNQIAVGGDGAIYVNNLTTQSTTSPLKVYSWATPTSTPTVAYSGNGGLAGARVGDSLAVTGSGSSTSLALGYGNSPSVTGNNGYAIINPQAGTATAVGLTGTTAGDFRLGITFAGPNQVLGSQGSSLYRNTTFSGATGTLVGSATIPDPPGATADHLLSYNVLDGVDILAVQSTGDSHVSFYNDTDPNNPVYLGADDTTTGTLTANSNGTGELAWGAVTINPDGSETEPLYALSTSQGIQAILVTVAPEPSDIALAAIGGCGFLFWRRRPNRR